MLTKIGYSLINSQNTEVSYWGNTLGVDISLPEYVKLPNGSVVYSFSAGETLSGGYKVVERWVSSNPTTEWDTKTGESIAFDVDKTVVTYNYQTAPVETLKSKVKEQVAEKRWAYETRGVECDIFTYSTDRESQTKYIAISLELASANVMTWGVRWKTDSGQFTTLNVPQMANVISTVLTHVRTAYQKESDLIDIIDACSTVPQVLQVDIETAWS